MDDIMSAGGGPKSALGALEKVGDRIGGFIIGDPEKKPDMDDQTKEQKRFPSGDLKWIWLVPIQTDQRDDAEDDGKRTLWLSWKSLTAFTMAVKDGWKAAGRTGNPRPEIGGYIEMVVTKVTPTGYMKTVTKDWGATYVPPDAAPATMDMMSDGDQPTSPAPQSAAPVSTPPAANKTPAQQSVLDRMREQAARMKAGGPLPPPPHHAEGEPPF